MGKPGVEELLHAFRALPAKKQLAFVEELHAGVAATRSDGFVVTARTRREQKRLLGNADANLAGWIAGFDAGEVFYDVGANVGSVTLAVASRHTDRVRIIPIEPAFPNFESLVRNLARNDLLSFAIPLQVALLDRTGILPLNYRSLAPGSAYHEVGEPRGHMGEIFEPVAVQWVPTFRLDDLIPMLQLPAPTRLKVDVDGFEELVVRGARDTLRSGCVRDLVVEIVDHDGTGTRVRALQQLFAEAGYDLAEVFPHEATHGQDSSPVADYWFVRQRTGS